MCRRLLFFIGLYLWASTTVAAQIVAYQLSLKDSTQNNLYIGYSNKIAIKNLPADAQVKFDDEYIKPTGGNYIIRPEKTGNCKLYVYDKNNNEIFSKEFIASRTNGPVPQIGIAKYRHTSINEILANPALVFYCGDCELKSDFRIISYTISLFTKDSTYVNSVCGDDLTNVPFDKATQDKIARMREGGSIFVESIKAFDVDGAIRHLIPIVLYIPASTHKRQVSSGNTGLRDEVSVIVDEIAATNKLIPGGYGVFEKLQEIATDNELIQLTDNKNAAVKNYAFTALKSRKNVDPFPILLRHIRDTASVLDNSAGCVSISWPTNEHLLLGVQPTGRKSETYKLTPPQDAIVDSMLLFDTSIIFGMRDYILSYMKPDPKYYDPIRELALTGKQPIAVLILAKYKNKNDIGLIKKLYEEGNEYYGVRATREFPDASFYPILKTTFEKEWAELKPQSDCTKWAILYEVSDKALPDVS